MTPAEHGQERTGEYRIAWCRKDGTIYPVPEGDDLPAGLCDHSEASYEWFVPADRERALEKTVDELREIVRDRDFRIGDGLTRERALVERIEQQEHDLNGQAAEIKAQAASLVRRRVALEGCQRDLREALRINREGGA